MPKKTVKGNFEPSRSAEAQFYRQLKKVAQASAHIIDQYTDGVVITNERALLKALNDYSKALTPWATRQAAVLLEQVQKSNRRAYQNKSKAIGAALREGVATPTVRLAAAALLEEQVGLIKSIPIEAGQRAQRIAKEAVLSGTRAVPDSDTIAQLQEEMGMTEEVARNRAMLIARTETARATAVISQARAMSVGSRQYRWHNSGDGAVRPSHLRYRGKKLQGMIFSWDSPPTLDDGMTGHPGEFPNCRCFAEPVFDVE